jgi:hypothetical protein
VTVIFLGHVRTFTGMLVGTMNLLRLRTSGHYFLFPRERCGARFLPLPRLLRSMFESAIMAIGSGAVPGPDGVPPAAGVGGGIAIPALAGP